LSDAQYTIRANHEYPNKAHLSVTQGPQSHEI